MEAQRVLIIASNPVGTAPLDIRPEVQAILRAHGRDSVDVLYSPTRIDVAEKIGEKNYQILHLAGHCSADGFLVKDGILSPSTIASYALSMAPDLRLVIINACSSDNIAREIGATANVDVVFTERDIEDEECIDYAVLFHRKLRGASAADYTTAHAQVDPSGQNFKYRIGREMEISQRMPNDERLGRMERTLDELRTYMIGTLEKPGLNSTVNALVLTVQSYDQRMKQIETFSATVSLVSAHVRIIEDHEVRLKRIESTQADSIEERYHKVISEQEFYVRLGVVIAVGILIMLAIYALSAWGAK